MWWPIIIIFLLILWDSGVSSRRYKDLNERLSNIEDKLEEMENKENEGYGEEY